jgi:NAD(P)-dependent dehydrogenase (short-subunit alcohol dehydrogenase family)
MSGRLEGRVALVTGAAHGQGAFHARHLAAEGADVVCVDICAEIDGFYPMGTRAELDETVANVEAEGRRGLALEVDQRDDARVQAAVAEAEAHFGRIDVLVNNAAVCAVVGILEMTTAEMDVMFDVNLKGPFNFVRHVGPGMKDRGFGRIINISSAGGLRALSYVSHYAATKAGIINAGRSWANELGPFGITVNAVCPGVIRTPMNDGMLTALGTDLDEGYADFETRNILKGDVNPLVADDISRAVVYLASEDGRAVTGQTLAVDAGWTSS